MLSTKILQEKLAANLIPFLAQKVNTSLLWSGPETESIAAMQDACSYMIQPGSPAASRVFLAERYGGRGLQRNGGGARCGIFGGYQVKGIGANPLVGKGTSWQHANGTLGVTEAIYEAIWGEILDEVLPFGAVKVQAILLTDRYIHDVPEETTVSDRRALLVRSPAIRPAHFERAPYFRPKEEFSGQLMHDARRVRAVISHLPHCLPQPECGYSPEAKNSPEVQCIEGLCELARRLAWQLAYCRTRFLKITTSPSNVAIDGRLLDFNGLGCLFPTDNVYDFGYQLRLKEMMKEPAILRKGLTDLTVYLGKYLYGVDFSLHASQQIQKMFVQTFELACLHGYLSLLGIDFDETVSLNTAPEAFKDLATRFLQLLAYQRHHFCDRTSEEQSPALLERVVLQLYGEIQDKKLQNNRRFQQLQRCLLVVRPFIKKSDSELAQLGLLRLQPRPNLHKLQMFSEINQLLACYVHDESALYKVLSNMVADKKAFARDALGTIATKGF